MPSRICNECKADTRTWAHLDRCVETDERPYVRCVVPGCGIWTRTPTDEGMCPPHLWDIRHMTYFYVERKRGAA